MFSGGRIVRQILIKCCNKIFRQEMRPQAITHQTIQDHRKIHFHSEFERKHYPAMQLILIRLLSANTPLWRPCAMFPFAHVDWSIY